MFVTWKECNVDEQDVDERKECWGRIDWSRRVEFSTRQDSIRVRILDLSIQVELRCLTWVFESSQRVEIEYRPGIPDSARQDIKIDR